MDPLLHTLIAVGLMFISFRIGTFLAYKRGFAVGQQILIDKMIDHDYLSLETLANFLQDLQNEHEGSSKD